MASNGTTLPPPEPFDFPTVNPKPLQPLDETPPSVTSFPSLPTPPRKSLIDKWYTLTTHLVPVACPRITPFLPVPPLPKWSPNKEEFKASVNKVVQEILAYKEGQRSGKWDGLEPNRKPMWNCLNRYVRRGLQKGDTKGVTLFFAHANGFPKEIWEPALQQIVAKQAKDVNYEIDEIWSWEAANHGDACIVNRDNLGGIYDWRDNSRDILHFLLHYLPTTVSPESLPTHLPRLSDAETEARKKHGLEGRKIVYVGHSFGGASLVRAAIARPILFKLLYMIDAMIRPMLPGTSFTTSHIYAYVTGAVQRRDGWSSREEALKAFSATPFFQVWDPASLKIYVECGLYEAPDGQVKLKMPGVQEAICFAEGYTPCETFELLPQLDERVETRWLIAAKLSSLDLELRRHVAWRRPVNSSHCLVQSGHLIAQEAPSALAEDLLEFLNNKFGQRKAML